MFVLATSLDDRTIFHTTVSMRGGKSRKAGGIGGGQNTEKATAVFPVAADHKGIVQYPQRQSQQCLASYQEGSKTPSSHQQALSQRGRKSARLYSNQNFLI